MQYTEENFLIAKFCCQCTFFGQNTSLIEVLQPIWDAYGGTWKKWPWTEAVKFFSLHWCTQFRDFHVSIQHVFFVQQMRLLSHNQQGMRSSTALAGLQNEIAVMVRKMLATSRSCFFWDIGNTLVHTVPWGPDASHSFVTACVHLHPSKFQCFLFRAKGTSLRARPIPMKTRQCPIQVQFISQRFYDFVSLAQTKKGDLSLCFEKSFQWRNFFDVKLWLHLQFGSSLKPNIFLHISYKNICLLICILFCALITHVREFTCITPCFLPWPSFSLRQPILNMLACFFFTFRLTLPEGPANRVPDFARLPTRVG